jgi:single-strand DNA-binding protein
MFKNRIEIIGSLGQDAAFTTTKSKKQLTKFTVAVNKTWQDKDGNPRKSTDWFPVVAWGKLADFAKQFKKGDPVHIEGELRSGEYTKDDVKHRTYEITARTVIKLARLEPQEGAESFDQSVTETAA